MIYASSGNSLSSQNNFARIFKISFFSEEHCHRIYFYLCHLTAIMYFPTTTVSHSKVKQTYKCIRN